MNTQTRMAFNKKHNGYPLCPTCGSLRIYAVGANTAGVNIVCRDCESLFAASQITGYGHSDDSVQRKCDCGVVHDGLTATCSRCAQKQLLPDS